MWFHACFYDIAYTVRTPGNLEILRKKFAFALQAFPALVTEYAMPLEINTATVIAVPVPFYYGNIQRATIPCIIQTSVIF